MFGPFWDLTPPSVPAGESPSRASKPSSATVLEMKYDRLKDLARVELKLYPTADDIKTKVVDLKVEILQICGHAKKIEYDESTGIMTVVEFEEQSFVQPAQSSQ